MAGLSAIDDLREVLRREIIEIHAVGDLLPNERELAERFGVARNTVRETMIHLEAFGLIEKTRRGARVRKPEFDPIFTVFAQHFDNSPRTMQDVLDFRRIVETGAAYLAARHADADVIDRMKAANDRMAAALTVAEAAGHDHEFHLGLVEATGNAVLGRMYRVMAVTLRHYLEIGKSQRPDTEAAFGQHAVIIAALAAGDGPRLAAELNTHFDHSATVFAALGARAPLGRQKGEDDDWR